ncbi:MAG: trigger factor [Alphaproteobacteria bacterium]
MQITVKETGKLNRDITVTIPQADVQRQFEAKLMQIGEKQTIPGFRPGKAPIKLLQERFGDRAFHEMEHDLINKGLSKALVDNKLNMAGMPKIDHAHDHDAGKDFTFTAHIELFPTFEPMGLDTMVLTRETAKPDDEMVNKALADLQGRLQNFAEKKGKAAKGDRVLVTGQGYTVKGKTETAFDGGNLKDFAIVLGSNSLIPGFEDQLIGAKAGDKVDVKVDFPKEYHAAELAGQPAVFKLTVDKVEAPEAQELNDDFAKQLGQDSMAKLKELIAGGLQRDLDSATQQRLKRHLFDHLDTANSFDLPSGLVEREMAGLLQGQLNNIQRRGMTPEQAGINMEELKAEMAPLATRRVKLGLVLAEIAKREKLQVEEADLRRAIMEQMQHAGPQAQQVQEYFSNPQNRQQLAGPILEQKATDWLVAKAKVTDKTVKASELLEEFA